MRACPFLKMGELFAAYLNDLHQFDPSTLTWTDLSEVLGPDSDPPPTARYPPMPRFEPHLFAVPRQRAALVDFEHRDSLLGRSQSGLAAVGDTLYLFGGISVDGLKLIPTPPHPKTPIGYFSPLGVPHIPPILPRH